VTEALALRDSPQPVALSSDQLNFISRTEFIPQGLRGNLPAILACVTTGRELGLGDMTSLRSIHIIDGKASFSAELMTQLVRKQGHSIQGDVTAEHATVVGKRADNGDTMTVEWTLEMANRVGLLSKSNWKKYPESMLWARAVSQLCRMLFADCFAGASYTPEELGSGDMTADELMADTPVAESDPSQFTTLPGESFEDIFEGDNTKPPREIALTPAQTKKLNVLVGQLRDANRLETVHLYAAVGVMRDVDSGDLAHALEAIDGDGVWHWGPLRDTLSREEASSLIDRLQKLQDAT
jgi:hypothetical protein